MGSKTTERQRHLGRGLESLLGPIRPQEKVPETANVEGDVDLASFIDKTLDHSAREVPVSEISVNPYQSRSHFDEGKLDELATSIRANGIIQPIVLRRTSSGYEIIAGERRFRASQMIGMKAIPAIVRDATDAQMMEWALVENIHRADLNPLERAQAYESYMNTFSLTQTEAAERLGEDRSVVCNYLRLLQLPADLHDMLRQGLLSMGHFRALLSLPNDDLKRRLANRALAGRLSVREVERLVRQYQTEGTTRDKAAKSPDRSPHIRELEGRLTSAFGNRVRIDTRGDGRRGKVVIEFGSLDEFDALLSRLGVDCSDGL